jgi:hypothetical protein
MHLKKLLVTPAIALLMGLSLSAGPAHAAGTPVAPGDLMINEYASTNNASGNDFFELLVLNDNVDLRGLRVSDNELNTAGVSFVDGNESVFVFGNDTYLESVPKGTVITVWTLITGVTTDTTIDPANSDFGMVLAPGTGVTATRDGISAGAANTGFANGGDAIYVYTVPSGGNSLSSGLVFLDFVAWGAQTNNNIAPTSLTGPVLPVTPGPNGYYTGTCAGGSTGNDGASSWVTTLLAGTTIAAANPAQDLTACQVVTASVPYNDPKIMAGAAVAVGVVAVGVRRRRKAA